MFTRRHCFFYFGFGALVVIFIKGSVDVVVEIEPAVLGGLRVIVGGVKYFIEEDLSGVDDHVVIYVLVNGVLPAEV